MTRIYEHFYNYFMCIILTTTYSNIEVLEVIGFHFTREDVFMQHIRKLQRTIEHHYTVFKLSTFSSHQSSHLYRSPFSCCFTFESPERSTVLKRVLLTQRHLATSFCRRKSGRMTFFMFVFFMLILFKVLYYIKLTYTFRCFCEISVC